MIDCLDVKVETKDAFECSNKLITIRLGTVVNECLCVDCEPLNLLKHQS